MSSELKLIDQTEFGIKGNCFSACLATVLGLGIGDVPTFAIGDGGGDGIKIDARARKWLWAQGWDMWPMPVKNWPEWKQYSHPDHYTIVTVPSDLGEGYCHCVIYKGGKLLHNPIPDAKTLEPASHAYVLFPAKPFEAWNIRPSGVWVPEELMSDLISELEAEINNRYPEQYRNHPSTKRRYERDMAVVIKAKAMLKTLQGKDG